MLDAIIWLVGFAAFVAVASFVVFIIRFLLVILRELWP